MADGDNTAFDELMAQMGVRRMDQGPRSARKKGRKGSSKAARPSGTGARKVAEGRGGAAAPVAATKPSAHASPEQTVAAPPLPAQASTGAAAAADADPGVIADLRNEVASLRRELEAARTRADSAEAECAQAVEQRDRFDIERRGLQRRLEAAVGDRPAPMPPLGDALQRRGILGEHEAARMLKGLIEARRVGPLLRLLEATDGESLHTFLEDRVVLHCGGEACPVVPGRAVVRVPSKRCEVCGGSDIQRVVRGFVDACLLTGRRHVVVVGGSPRYHRQLRELVQHHRLQIELVPGNVRRTMRQAQADMARADVVIIWGATVLDHSVADLYKDGPSHVVRIAHRGMGRMLQMAAEAVQALDGGD